jgi:muramoyltetrapeptide carboxypeptidase
LTARAGRSKTPILGRGDLVGVVATGFAVRRELLDAGVLALRRMGFRVRIGEHVLDRAGYLAGSDEDRACDLIAMLEDPNVRAIWFARGGYGTARILRRLPWRKLRTRPLLFVGYSDLTALFSATVDRTEVRCLYGPVVTELGSPESYHRPSLRRALAGERVEIRLNKRDVIVPGRARGALIGGNLSVLTHLLGTPYAPRPAGRILFLEEVGEQAYRIDAALTQAQSAGAFRKLRGVILGDFNVPRRRRFPPDRPWLEVVSERFRDLGIPVVSGLPVGHVARKWTLPLGGTVDLDTESGRVRFDP